MANQSSVPPNSSDDKPLTTASEVPLPKIEVSQDAKAEVAQDNSTSSVFVNPEPIREEQVQNAVKFLSHPRVRGSPVIYRRSFLERKGLTKEEIDEAFRRVPDPPPAVSTAQPDLPSQDGQLNASSSIKTQAQTQAPQLSAVGPGGAVSKVGIFSRFNWSQALLAVGLLTLSGVGTAILFKNAFVPRLESWIRRVVLEEEEDPMQKSRSRPSSVEEATVAAKAAAAAAVDVARASKELLDSKTEDRRYYLELVNLLDLQVQEMKSMNSAIQKLEGKNNLTAKTPFFEQENGRVSVSNSQQPYANGKVEIDSRSVRSSSPSVEPSVAPHPKSYMEIIDMVQRGEIPSNIREINDRAPNPNQPLSNPNLAPRPKPWELGQPQNGSGSILQSQSSVEDFDSRLQDTWLSNQVNGDDSLPQLQPKNIRITHGGIEDEHKIGASSAVSTNRPIQRSWVPPQPPPVSIPEAAVAIRQPKKRPSQIEQLTDDQSVAPSSDVTDELQRVTERSESGGLLEDNGLDPGLNNGEIPKDGIPSFEA